MIGFPANKNTSRIKRAKTSSRATIFARRRGSKRASIALKTGMLPSGSITKKSVTVTAEISLQCIRWRRCFLHRGRQSYPCPYSYGGGGYGFQNDDHRETGRRRAHTSHFGA